MYKNYKIIIFFFSFIIIHLISLIILKIFIDIYNHFLALVHSFLPITQKLAGEGQDDAFVSLDFGAKYCKLLYNGLKMVILKLLPL